MNTDVKELVARLRDEMGSIGGPLYTQMMQQRLEAATALEAQAEEIARLRPKNIGASGLEALGMTTEEAFRETAMAEWVRAGTAERERDALKLNVRQLEEFIGRREDDLLSIARERDALKAENERMRTLVDASTITAVSGMLVENDRIRKAYAIIECAVMELMPYYGDDYRRFIDKKMAAARAALHPTQGGE